MSEANFAYNAESFFIVQLTATGVCRAFGETL